MKIPPPERAAVKFDYVLYNAKLYYVRKKPCKNAELLYYHFFLQGYYITAGKICQRFANNFRAICLQPA